MAAALASRTRDPYRFANHDDLPSTPRDTLALILKYWDTTSDPTTYLDYFTPNAVLKFGGDHHGHKGIRAARDGMIHPEKGPIILCQHYFENAFVLGGGSSESGPWEIIGVADVRYTLVGTKEEVWTRAASWTRIVMDGGKAKAEAYEVFMDGSQLFGALGRLGKV